MDDVKGMQWLILEVRFVEPLNLMKHPKDMAERGCLQFQKVGEVVQEMRRTDAVKMGIGHGNNKCQQSIRLLHSNGGDLHSPWFSSFVVVPCNVQ